MYFNLNFYPRVSATDLKYDYGKALSMSILFYDAQRTGALPDNSPIGWRGDTFLDDADGIDLSGGWFDGVLYLSSSNMFLFWFTCTASPFVAVWRVNS